MKISIVICPRHEYLNFTHSVSSGLFGRRTWEVACEVSAHLVLKLFAELVSKFNRCPEVKTDAIVFPSMLGIMAIHVDIQNGLFI